MIVSRNRERNVKRPRGGEGLFVTQRTRHRYPTLRQPESSPDQARQEVPVWVTKPNKGEPNEKVSIFQLPSRHPSPTRACGPWAGGRGGLATGHIAQLLRQFQTSKWQMAASVPVCGGSAEAGSRDSAASREQTQHVSRCVRCGRFGLRTVTVLCGAMQVHTAKSPSDERETERDTHRDRDREGVYGHLTPAVTYADAGRWESAARALLSRPSCFWAASERQATAVRAARCRTHAQAMVATAARAARCHKRAPATSATSATAARAVRCHMSVTARPYSLFRPSTFAFPDGTGRSSPRPSEP
jgi:hypothetical protein